MTTLITPANALAATLTSALPKRAASGLHIAAAAPMLTIISSVEADCAEALL